MADENELPRMIHPRDREIVALTYVLAIIPLFGILTAALIAMWYQERSRTVVFHAKQAIAGQAIFLLVFVVICLFSLFAALAGVLSPRLKEILVWFDWIVLYVTLFACVCWYGYFAWMTLGGHDLEYPLIGARLRDRSE